MPTGPPPDWLKRAAHWCSLARYLSLSLSHSPFLLFFFLLSPHPLIFLTLIVFTFSAWNPMTLVKQYNMRGYVFLSFTNSQENTRINNPLAYHFLYEIELDCWTNPAHPSHQWVTVFLYEPTRYTWFQLTGPPLALWKESLEHIIKVLLVAYWSWPLERLRLFEMRCYKM